MIYNGITMQSLGERDGWHCYVCDLPIDRTAASGWDAPCVDHIIPTIKGGVTAFDNLAIVHVRCNAVKGTAIIGHPSWGPIREKALQGTVLGLDDGDEPNQAS